MSIQSQYPTTGCTPVPPGVELQITSIKYSSLVYLRNGRSVIWDCIISSQAPLHGATLVIEYTPDYICTEKHNLGSILPGKPYHFVNHDVPHYDDARLLALEDEQPGKVKVTLIGPDNSAIACKELDFTWLAHNAWAGGHEFPELLAALTIPEDPFVDELLDETRKRLARSGRPDAWEGYKVGADTIVTQLNTLWDAIGSKQINYALPPESWRDEGVGQRVRTPSQIREGNCATCLDSTLLLAAVVTRMNLNPIVVLTKGHAFIGVWLKPAALLHPKEQHPATVRNYLKQGELLLLETTTATQSDKRGPLTFDWAAGTGAGLMDSIADEDYFLALDIRKLWHECNIHPIHGAMGSTYHARDDEEELVSSLPKSRIDTWQLKLLDLSLRNNMLNCKPNGARQLQLLLPNVGELEDDLSKGTSFRIKAMPETLWTAITAYNQGKESEFDNERISTCTRSMYGKKELTVLHNEKELQKRLQVIYSTTRREMEESGANTLYLACGFLKWHRDNAPDKQYLAPILLIPVRLTRPSIKSGFVLRGYDEETRINLTLLEYLKTEYELTIPELEGDLPTDNYGLDTQLIFNMVRRAITSKEGWEVVETCSLGSFSFTKYLMWKDLVSRRDDLMKNAVIRQIADENRTPFPEQKDFPAPAGLDNDVDAQNIYTPMSSDSSQLSAIIAAGRGKNFVLIGPPGTGKSQTITNMIAHCLGHGKTVLFVAEKSAALNVVHRRLKHIGLDDFCLELHSHKANKKDALAQFKKSVDCVTRKQDGQSRWGESVYSMASTRYQLNLLPWEMHKTYPDGSCLYGDLCTIARHDRLPVLPLVEDDPLTMGRERLLELRDAVAELAHHFQLVEQVPDMVLASLRNRDYNSAWENSLAETLTQYAHDCTQLAIYTEQFHAAICGAVRRERLAGLLPLLESWQKEPQNATAALLPGAAQGTLATLARMLEHAEKCREMKSGLTLPYPDSTLDEPELDSMLRQCKELTISNAVTRWLGMRKIARFLKGQALSPSTPDCLSDLTRLVALRNERNALSAINQTSLPEHLRKGSALTREDVQAATTEASRLAALSPEDTGDLRMLLAQPDLLPTQSNASGRALTLMGEASRRVSETAGKLRDLLGKDLPPDSAATWVDSILANREHWREICLWNKVAAAAGETGCQAVAEHLAMRTIPPQEAVAALLVSLADKRIHAVADSSEILGSFISRLHEGRIKDFEQKDHDLQSITTTHIKAMLAQRASSIADFGSETSILHREMMKQRAHMPLRQLLSSIPHITPLLKPCMLMSPLSVAQYLDSDREPFDVVIFDEASQIPVWDAIGAIARGKSAVIVGDPRQMPPTSFFSRCKMEDTDEATDGDMESILDECRACGIPELNLAWHYRSKSESLIAFSNKKYYDNGLVTFPAPVTEDMAITYHYVEGGTYEPGQSRRINQAEARQLVDHVLGTLRQPDFRYTEATSIGIVTFNGQQQALIEAMLLEERAKDDSLEAFFSEDNPEAIFVKNLENVQGDERGIIYFSTTFGYDDAGKLSMNFGPLNLLGGERRLNVAITRARCAMHLFTSLLPEDIDLSRTTARGAADLKDFLSYAKTGTSCFKSTQEQAGLTGLADRLASELEIRGWKCMKFVGVSSYRIDLAVEHPDIPGTTLAGIMLDGESYASSNTARDRDILRPTVLTGLGWRLLRVWAIDWWRHPAALVDSIDRALREYRTMGPPVPPELPELISQDDTADSVVVEHRRSEKDSKLPPLKGKPYSEYKRAELLPPLFEINDTSLRSVLHDIISTEAPLQEPFLLERLKANSVTPYISDSLAARISSIITGMEAEGTITTRLEPTKEHGVECRVITLAGQPQVSPREKGPREWSQIPLSEFISIAKEVREHHHLMIGSAEHIKAIATYIGLARQTKQFKDFISNLLRSNAENA